MSPTDYPDEWPDIDTDTYDRSVRLFRVIKKLLRVKIELHATSQPEDGEIFLFNHFSRFETFIPQFLIYERTGSCSCAIASREFFREDTALSRYLKTVGVFPNDHPRLFPMLAAQILRGRKVIIFPEGGMVKDRNVVDRDGNYTIFSRITGKRRKPHTGAAVLAQGLEAFKTTIRNAYRYKRRDALLRWMDQLQLDSLDQLLMAALKPTLIVPANITFYPLRSSESPLQKGIELLSNHLTPRHMEEILIESNILVKETDMDIRMGAPADPRMVWHWWNRYILELFSSDFATLDEVFALDSSPQTIRQRILGRYFRTCANATRDQYMAGIYANVTVNLSHLASSLIMECIAQGHRDIGKEKFYTTLYLAIRELQKSSQVHLHRSLVDPNEYIDLIDGRSRRFEQFICRAKEHSLISEDAVHYRFEAKLSREYDLDVIRLENPIAVYNNEVTPIRLVRETLTKALRAVDELKPRHLATWRLEDEVRALREERRRYLSPQYDDINRLETATAPATPFVLESPRPNGVGVLLIHGLLASPAEVLAYGEHLVQAGYTVLGVRLKGHGSSPYALRDQTWQDWYDSVRRGFATLQLYCRHIVAIGFSTGGALALRLAARHGADLAAVVALSVPIKFINPALILVPLLHGTNKVVNWVSSYDGFKSFIYNATEHPRINYTWVPVRSLYQLRRLIEELDDCLGSIEIPTMIIYADQDPVVSPKSAPRLMEKLATADKRLVLVPATRHGILMENLGETWQRIDAFIADLRLSQVARCDAAANPSGDQRFPRYREESPESTELSGRFRQVR
ncbi:MAG: alpha/beta fold hydrolase [Methylotetracoccus sp.]